MLFRSPVFENARPPFLMAGASQSERRGRRGRGAPTRRGGDVYKRQTEIRLRSGRPVLLTLPEGGRYLLPDGALEEREGGRSVRLTHGQLSECFLALCQYSVHSYEREIAEGFFTIGGGHRVGVAGTAVRDAQGGILQIKSPTSLCIRVARTPNGLLPPQLTDLLTEPALGLLIAGAPGSGKTTVLRACSRALSGLGRRTAVVDERRELWPAEELSLIHI